MFHLTNVSNQGPKDVAILGLIIFAQNLAAGTKPDDSTILPVATEGQALGPGRMVPQVFWNGALSRQSSISSAIYILTTLAQTHELTLHKVNTHSTEPCTLAQFP